MNRGGKKAQTLCNAKAGTVLKGLTVQSRENTKRWHSLKRLHKL